MNRVFSLVMVGALVGCGGDDASLDTARGGNGDAAGGGSGLIDASSAASDAQTQATPDDAGAGPSTRSNGNHPGALETLAYVGGWDWGSGMPYPFGAFALSHQTGSLSARGTSSALGFNPAFATPSRDGTRLYIANEFPGERAGITVARIDPATGIPAPYDHVGYADGAFVYAAVHPSGDYLFAADFYGGRLVVYGLEKDGKLGAVTATESFPRKSEADSAQSHSVGIHPNGRFVYVPNKAIGIIAQLTFDPASGKLTRRADVKSMGGPRHIAIHDEIAYVMHEEDSQLASFRISASGDLTPVARRSALPSDFTGKNTGAHVLVHPNGKFVYVSNRGHDSIAVFATSADGALTLIGHTPTQGKTPRHFDMDVRGELLVVANQGSDGVDDGSLTTFAIGADGKLTPRGAPVTGLKSPTSVVLISQEKPDP